MDTTYNAPYRPPPGPPPAYSRVIARVYKRSMRPIVLFCTFISAVYCIVRSVEFLKSIGGRGETARLKVVDIVFGVLYLFAGVVQAIGFCVSLIQRLSLVRPYVYGSFLVAGLVTLLELVRLILHFTLKGESIGACVERYTNAEVRTGWYGGGRETLDADEARDYCNDSWTRGSWTNVVWLIAVGVLAALFLSINLQFLRQLQDPESVIHRSQLPPSAYAMQPQMPYNRDPPFVAPDYVPPYPGPPAGGYDASKADEHQLPPATYDPDQYAGYSPAPLSYTQRYDTAGAPPPGAGRQGGGLV